MIAAASSARSLAVDTCCGAGSPVAVAKRVFFIPRRAASLFMRSTNASSEPASVSASAIAASLPETTIIPWSNSSTLTAFFGSMNMREPSARHALAETLTICEGTRSLSLSARKIRYAVISFVSDAGSRGSSALCAASVCPLSTSTSRYALAAMAGGGTAADTNRSVVAGATLSAAAATRATTSGSQRKSEEKDIRTRCGKSPIIPRAHQSLGTATIGSTRPGRSARESASGWRAA